MSYPAPRSDDSGLSSTNDSSGLGSGLGEQRAGSFRAIHPYIPQHDGEIELNAGDCITNAKDLSNGWTVGRNINNQAVGIFPSACVIEEALLVPADQTVDDGLWYGLDPDALDRLSTLSTDDTCDRESQLFALGPGDPFPPPPDITENTPHTDPPTIDDSKLYALSPSSNKGLQKKPQLLVKPNLAQTDTPVKTIASTMPHQQEQPTVWCQQQPHPALVQRMNSQESMLNPERSTYVPPRSSTPAPSRHNSQPNLLRSGRPSVDATSLESTERQNVANETLNNNNSGAGGNLVLNNVAITPQQLADIKRSRYYEDYRTLQCPAHDDEDTDIIIPPHVQPPPPQQQYQYKPILKKKRRNDNIPVDPTAARGGSPEIYYADTEVYGSEHDLDDRPRSLRLVVSVLCGLLSGFLLFLWMYHALRYSFLAALIAGTSLVALASVAFTASRLCRCIGAILLPSLCTTRGRIAFLILIGGFLLDGAVTNVYQNMEEVSRSMACSTEQSYNQSMLLLQPFDAMMLQLNSTVDRLQRASADIGHSLRPLSDGLEVMEMDLETGDVELQTTAKTCKTMVDTAFDDCWQGIESAQTKCLGVIDALGTVYHQARDVLDRINPDRWAGRQAATTMLHKRQTISAGSDLEGLPENERDICEPLDVKLVCHSLNDSSNLCLPSGWAGEAIQETVNTTKSAIARLHRTLRFDVKPDPFENARVNASRFVYQIRRGVHAEFQSKTKHFRAVVDIAMKLIPISLFLLLYAAYDHVRRFVSRDEYDNTYVTASFKRLDRKRAEFTHAESLLPLKKYERNLIIDATVSELTTPEDGLYRIGLAVYTLHLVLAIVCYIFDYVLYWILAMVRAHGNPKIDVTGRNSLELVVQGEGVVADLLQVFLKGFHPANLFGYTLDMQHCLPRPTVPSLTLLLVIFALYFCLLLTVLLKAYLLRARNRLTAYFYADREKARVVHLYNVVLNHRRRMPRLLQQKARRNHRERIGREGISVCHKMASRVPPCRAFVYSRIKCLVCGCPEDQTFRDCSTERCTGVYCSECYDDLLRACPLCQQSPEYAADSTSNASMCCLDTDDYEQMDGDLQPYSRSSKIYV